MYSVHFPPSTPLNPSPSRAPHRLGRVAREREGDDRRRRRERTAAAAVAATRARGGRRRRGEAVVVARVERREKSRLFGTKNTDAPAVRGDRARRRRRRGTSHARTRFTVSPPRAVTAGFTIGHRRGVRAAAAAARSAVRLKGVR